MATIGALSAPGSAAVHDAVSASFIAAGGAHLDEMRMLRVPWLSGHDDYRCVRACAHSRARAITTACVPQRGRRTGMHRGTAFFLVFRAARLAR